MEILRHCGGQFSMVTLLNIPPIAKTNKVRYGNFGGHTVAPPLPFQLLILKLSRRVSTHVCTHPIASKAQWN